jgi:hypothetical protein
VIYGKSVAGLKRLRNDGIVEDWNTGMFENLVTGYRLVTRFEQKKGN